MLRRSPRLFPVPSTLSLGSLLLLLLPQRAARAEDMLSVKYQDYREGDGRVAVKVQSMLAEKNLGAFAQLRLTGTIDTIAGATPSGEPPATPGGPVPLSQMHDRRKAWGLDFSRRISVVKLSAGFAQSRESDYVSNGGSLNGQVDCNQINTILLVGAAATADDVRVFYREPWEDKRGRELIVGVTQLLDAQTSVTANLSWGRTSGYLSDPYKLIRRITEIVPGLSLPLTFPENRPAEREKWVLYGALNRFVPAWNGAIEASARHYTDDWGVRSLTLQAAWLQKLGERWTLSPSARWYRQSAADFYCLSLDGSPIVPTLEPRRAGPFYSADYRLARLESWTYGLKLAWQPVAAWQLDAAWERYAMQGRDGGRTSASAFPRAHIFTAGLKYSW